jgi:methionyl aminopeptidase
MSIESPSDLSGLRAAGRVVADALRAMKRHVSPGVSTADLDDVAAGVIAAAGARSAPALVYAFPGTTCISVNDEIVHGIPGSRRLRPGDLVTLDVTVELDGYFADAAITVPVPPVSAIARRLCACAASAFYSGLDVATAGAPLSRVGAAIQSETERRGFRVFRDLSGHGIGRTIHEEPTVPNHFDPSARERLTDGLVITIEPLVGAGAARTRLARDGWTVRTADGSLSAHHEHTIVITRGRPRILTAA